MPQSILEIFEVIACSRRMQSAIILGIIAFVVINLVGSCILNDFKLDGQFSILSDVIKQQIEGKYNDAAWGALFSSWGLAINFYRKDKKRIWESPF
jgi:hypothetical protein